MLNFNSAEASGSWPLEWCENGVKDPSRPEQGLWGAVPSLLGTLKCHLWTSFTGTD